MTPAQAIVAVTRTGAIAAKGSKDFGTIEEENWLTLLS